MICLIQNVEDYNNDLRVILMAFYMGVKIITPENIEKKPELGADVAATLVAEFAEGQTKIWMKDGGLDVKSEGASEDKQQDWSAGEVCGKPDIVIDQDYHDRKVFRNVLKRAMYRMLSERTGRVLPWGSLTGVRPVKIAMEAVERGCTDEEIQKLYQETYVASREKAEACVKIARREKAIIETIDERNEYCLYIGIPFCPTRCLYCSFTSYPIGVYKDKVDAYLDTMEKEMEYIAESYTEKKLASIYIGGGTPSSISAEQMDRLCSMIEKHFDLSQVREYTIEAGRPDSTTADKLQVMKAHGVDRISINPQTVNGETLKLIGRAHTPEQAEEAFMRAREAGFDNINMDLIVGLPGEDAEMVKRTLEKVKKLAPESLTVHTLAIKRAAHLKQEMDKYSFAGDVDEQLSLVGQAAEELGLAPYYLYRQKNMAGNLENVGYARHGLECLYNILIMEERTDIIGIGAGSSSKLIRREGDLDPVTGETVIGNRIDRVENCKSVDDYIARIDEMIDRKKQAFAK